MSAMRRILAAVCAISCAYPRCVIACFAVIAVAGFTALPRITISTNLIAGIGDTDPVIRVTQENSLLFGEQDSLIVVLQFPEPPGKARLPLIQGVAERIADIPGVRRVVYRFLDPEDPEQTGRMFRHFLLGMNESERQAIKSIFSSEGMTGALRRNRNRLFLAQHPYVRKRILDDPLELGQFVARSVQDRLGNVSLGDIYLLIASPDSTMFLIQVTPDFPSADIVKGKELVSEVNRVLPGTLKKLKESIPGAETRFEGLTWDLTGKTVFHYESDRLFDREVALILLLSFGLVAGFLIIVYRSFRSVCIIMAPIAVAVGGNYGVVYLMYDEINPVVMASAGILFGLGTDFGVHLWGRFREVLLEGAELRPALDETFSRTGPPVVLGALTSVIAFLCLRLSDQPAMGQFGFVCASGVILALTATLFLFPAFAVLMTGRAREKLPLMRVRFSFLSRLFVYGPRTIAAVFVVVILVSIPFGLQLSYEKDLLKVFMAGEIESLDVAERVSRKFRSNFSQPTLLSFELKDPAEGIRIQRRMDSILAELREKHGFIATFDSISYLTAPPELKKRNREAVSEIVQAWSPLHSVFRQKVHASDLSDSASAAVLESFDRTGRILESVCDENGPFGKDEAVKTRRSWYTAKIDGKHRFLTKIRYVDEIADPDELKRADRTMMAALEELPVKVSISGPRQAMEAILATLVSELFRLGLVALGFVMLFFLIIFRNVAGVALSLIPMVGAFVITLGIMGAGRVGIPFSIIGVAPLIFGLGIDNGIHVVMRSLSEGRDSVQRVMQHMTPIVIVTSMTSLLGFLSMIVSGHYALRFLGWAMVIGMGSALVLTLVVLPAFLTLLEERMSGDRAEEAA